MKKLLFSFLPIALSLTGPILALIAVIRIFSVSITTVAIMGGILLVYGATMILCWSCLERAQRAELQGKLPRGGRRGVFLLALGISAPYSLSLFLLSLFPVMHYSFWLLVFLPAVILFSLPLTVVADFCSRFHLRTTWYWGIQLFLWLFLIFVGRSLAPILVAQFG